MSKFYGNEKVLLVFDLTRYRKETRASMDNAIKKSTDLIHERILQYLDQINFKDNPVRVIKGTNNEQYTSDAERKQAVIDNVVKFNMKKIGKYVFRGQVAFIKQNFQDAHIGIYYEHGVGSNWDGVEPNVRKPPGYSQRGSFGTKISSRSIRVDYSGYGGGLWVDLGGNLRYTQSPIEGSRGSGFRSYVGEETRAYHWFTNAFKYEKKRITKVFQRELKKANPLKKRFWRIAGATDAKGTFILGKD